MNFTIWIYYSERFFFRIDIKSKSIMRIVRYIIAKSLEQSRYRQGTENLIIKYDKYKANNNQIVMNWLYTQFVCLSFDDVIQWLSHPNVGTILPFLLNTYRLYVYSLRCLLLSKRVYVSLIFCTYTYVMPRTTNIRKL